MPHLRTILTAITTALLLAACTDDSIVDSVEQHTADDDGTIGFNSVGNNASKADTRATEIESNNIKDQHFRVWAYGFQGNTSETTPYMNDVDIHYSYDREEWVYTYSSQKARWPRNPIRDLDFWAACPPEAGVTFSRGYDATASEPPQRYSSAANYSILNDDGTLKVYDVVVAMRTKQVNITIKDNSYQDQTTWQWIEKKDTVVIDRNKKVMLNFQHLLSQVKFFIRTPSTNITARVRGISLGNLYTKAQFQFSEQTDALGGSDQWGTSDRRTVPLYMDSHSGDALEVDTTRIGLVTERPLYTVPQYVICTYNDGADTWNPLSDYNRPDTYIILDCDIYINGEKRWDGTKESLLLPFAYQGNSWPLTNGKRYYCTIILSGGFKTNGTKVFNPIKVNVTNQTWDNDRWIDQY